MNRIEERMKQLREKKEKAFITYITAGLPDLAATKELLLAQERGGADVVELGIPFSDPIADGPVIQEASYRAISNGATVKGIFSMLEEARAEGLSLPIVFMLYYNTVLHYGVEAFVKRCGEAGVDGLIIPDLPYEEQEEIRQFLDVTEQTILIPLVSPVSGERIPMLLEQARGFVYCVSSMGVTGQSADFHKEVEPYLRTVKDATELPVMIGFGIRTAADVKPLQNLIDGAIVGSHLIRLLVENDFAPQIAEDYCREFKRALNQSSL